MVDVAGQALRFTPHDFRRMFATDAVTGGLPVHIAARLLGHQHLASTQAYLAVFQDDLICSYRAFLDQRRTTRPAAEYREPTDAEWDEFQRHFALRKVELGTCARPYATPCQHEHTCIRCPMLRVDPGQRRRLVEITANLTERINEARLNGWLGEVEGLQISRNAAATKLAALDRQHRDRAPLAHPPRRPRNPAPHRSAAMTNPSDPHWRGQARCAETDPEAFFPPVGAVPHAALRICAHCPVHTDCLTVALARRDITYGVLGGLTPHQRRNLLRKQDTHTRRPGRAA